VIAALLMLAAGAAPQGSPRSAAAHAVLDTRCETCHSTASWTSVTFDHARTGFPLEGRHLLATCRSCHGSTQDFKTPVPTSCAACHRDEHAGELGTRCASCHDARDWTSRFGPDAHARTNFPLTGRHAAIPCEECHLDRRDRGFTRATVDCFTCHQADYARTLGTPIDHARAGFGTDCKSCHFPTSFKGARFAAHERCFQLAAGPHTGIPCLGCHTSLASAASTGACSTGTADCMRCHQCTVVTPVHRNVGGFQCNDIRCYQCHQFTVQGGARQRIGPGGPR